MSPVVELLRLVDGPGATISKVYFKMDALVERMRDLECVAPGKKADIEDILMHRWSFITSELHCAAAFLNPEFRHSALAERDREARAGFNIWLYSWAPKDKPTLDELSRQVDDWTKLRGSFNTREAAEAARVKPAALWWEAFGGKLDLLQPQAVKLLGQASSSAACERNWSLHELIFGRRRTKLMPERLSKLVFNNWNTQLIRSCTRGGKEEVHIPWEDDRPVQAEVEEWYNTWVATAVSNDDDAADTLDDAEVGEEDGDEPLMRTWLRNDEWDDQECEAEDIALGRRADGELKRKRGRPSNAELAAAADDNEAAAAGDEVAAAPSPASSSSSSDDEDASGKGAESMEHGEGDGDDTGDSSEGSEGQSGEEEEGDGGEE
ncbi:hypothetical protein CBR_g23315 [Chara braunii]|uniref:HAT C-terminal dimerisation domain-containing protein n=1 Tax=Chara braunii TaxID=69332 RepID=A0A388L3V1_CHABU|nr:hypothetical protein CBR_g23315 [Chara braunii]|eukprot:GBG76984.1 hypothetical protein CBR_g23315 [Chara braunii]